MTNLPSLLAEDPTDLASASLLVIRLRDAARELMKEVAGNEGELAGLRVSEAFFRERADVLESRLQLQHVKCFHCGQDFGEHERGAIDPAVREHVIHCSEHPLAKLLSVATAELTHSLSELARVDGLLAREREALANKTIERNACAAQMDRANAEVERLNTNQAAVSVAARRRERESTIAFLLDRAGQYQNSSGYVACIEELVQGIADGRHVECCAAGEYADLYTRVQRIMQRTDAKESVDG